MSTDDLSARLRKTARLLCADVHPTYLMPPCSLCIHAVDVLHRRALLAATDPAPDEACCIHGVDLHNGGGCYGTDPASPLNPCPCVTPPTVAPSDPARPCPTSGCSGTASRGQFCNRCAYGNPVVVEPDSIVEILTAERARLGLSMGVVAERIGTSKSSVHAWEHGVKSPSIGNAQAWAGALGRRLTVAPSDLPVATGDAASERAVCQAEGCGYSAHESQFVTLCYVCADTTPDPDADPAPVHADDTDAGLRGRAGEPVPHRTADEPRR